MRHTLARFYSNGVASAWFLRKSIPSYGTALSLNHRLAK